MLSYTLFTEAEAKRLKGPKQCHQAAGVGKGTQAATSITLVSQEATLTLDRGNTLRHSHLLLPLSGEPPSMCIQAIQEEL